LSARPRSAAATAVLLVDADRGGSLPPCASAARQPVGHGRLVHHHVQLL